MKTNLEHTAFETRHHELSDMRHNPEAMLRDAMAEVTLFINSKIKECNESGFRLEHVGIRWRNVPHPQDNPNSDRGFVRVVITRQRDDQVEVQPWVAVPSLP